MFTGIIQDIGIVRRRERSAGVVRLSVETPTLASRVQRLESVAVNGVCLTVVSIRQGTLAFEVIPETRRLTTLGRLRGGDHVNLEPSLAVTDRLNGHVVLGHVDGLGTVVRRRRLAGELVLEIRVPTALRTLLVPKGPVTVDGVSLTIGTMLTASTFSVHLIPETLRQTILADHGVGDRVNLEIDYFSKLISAWLRAPRR